MKKMFQRGFKPAKCKTALQLANSRLKILKNKTEIHIKQLRRELAQLLESGQTPKARIRVEHLVREEKRVAAYELIGLYCELLVLRLSVIESQKNCPIDLKEAVTSVLFASQRLSDVPELSEISKQFKTKYGKDFTTSAIELRPDSGVSRLLVEKLSAKSPDGPTKVKILLEIATEHNVVWEAKSFVEPDSRDTELLSGASSFQSASSINVDSSIVPNKEQFPNVQAPASVNVHHGSTETSYASDRRRSSSQINNVSYGKANESYNSNARPSRSKADEGECRNPNDGDVNSSSRSKQNWETDFVDSTDAARAAVEAAERASFAARVAAELSRQERMTRQGSTQSHLSSASVNFRENLSLRRDRSNLQSLENLRKYGSFGKSGNEKYPSEDQTSFNVGYSEDVHLRKQSSKGSCSSHSRNYSDDNVIGSDYTHDHGHDAAANSYDDYGSVLEKPKFDAEDEADHGVGFSLLGSKTYAAKASWSFKGDHGISNRKHSSSNSQIFPEKPISTLFDDVSTSPSASYNEPDLYAKFDDYGPNSETDDDQPRNRGNVSGGVDERMNLTSDRSQTREESDQDADAQTGLNFGPLLGGFRNKNRLPPYRRSSERNEALSKTEKEYSQNDDGGQSTSYSWGRRKDIYTEKRPNFMPSHPSSSDEDDSDTKLTEEDLQTRASTHKPRTGMRDKKGTNSKDEEEVERDDANVNSKSKITTGFSRRTKSQVKAHEKHSLPVETMKTEEELPDQPSPKHKPVVPETVTSREKASHVHPKLPDYDDIFASLGSLRGSNRR